MINKNISLREYTAPIIDRREVLRYAGVRESDESIEYLLDRCIAEASDKITYKLCYREFDISITEDEMNLGFAKTRSELLKKRLLGCNKIVLFCATVGQDIDRIIAKHSITSPSTAVIMQALGSERVEALCDAFCDEMKNKYGDITSRFSPGYGDLPLSLQKDIFLALEPTKLLGVTLNSDLFMTPPKTVTAIIGIKCKR